VASGVLGTAVLMNEPLLGQTVEVTGELFEVRYPGRTTYHRLLAQTIVGDGWIVPAPEADDEPADATASPTDAHAAEDAELSALPW
jgi:hypothetical protein